MCENHIIKTGDVQIPVYTCGLCVVGSGAAAWNGAHTARIEKDIPVFLVTEGVYMGTSRNTGSDKQTYYKQSTTALHADSPLEMAQDYVAGGAMHGDIALTEACGSLAGFYKLISLGVPFPHDRYGEYPGYRTDHDEKSRATSLGPLTSQKMTEALEKAARDAGVTVFDGYRAIQILVHDGEVCGIACISMKEIRKDNPGISGNELMLKAGEILKSEALIRAYSGKPKDPAAEKGRENRFGRMDVYSTVFVFLAFGIMIVLCFLL